ncbi:MAG: hypothetical protein R6U36_01810 [Candidatus Fermentibacteraceae bacterium]
MRFALTVIAAMMLALAACGGGEPAEEAGGGETAADTAAADIAEADVPVPEPEELPEDPAEAAAEPVLGPQSSWSMTMGELSLALEDDSVTGEYPLGTLRGTIDDRVVTFDYVEGDLTGTGMLQFDRTFQNFTGYQVMGEDTLEWVGERL